MSDLGVFMIWTYFFGRKAVCQILDHPEVEIVGATADQRSALDEIAHLQPSAGEANGE
jgi:hypothetical protein